MYKKIAIVSCGVILMASCSKFNLDKITYITTPNPLVLKGDSIQVSIKANYPEKTIPKKADAVLTPVLDFNGTSVSLKPLAVKGEKSKGKGQPLSHGGGSVTYTDVIPYKAGMQKSELHVKVLGTIKDKEKINAKTPQPIAYGVIVTPLLVTEDITVKTTPHQYGPVYKTHSAMIYFPYNSSEIRPMEKKSSDMEGFRGFTQKYAQESATFEKMEILGYASPEGSDDLNQKLSGNRAGQMGKYVSSEFTKVAKDSVKKGQNFMKEEAKGKDIAGFNSKLNQKSIEKKDQVKGLVNDGLSRSELDKKLKSLSVTLPGEVEKELMAPLRRAEVLTTVKLKPKTNEELKNAAVFNPSSLTVEEIHFAAQTLLTDNMQKVEAYRAAEKKAPEDWRAYNNAGVSLFDAGKTDEAETELRKAEKVAPSEKMIASNLGMVYLKKGDKAKAVECFKKASGFPDADYAMGAMMIRKGDYAEAVRLFGSSCSFNAALAQLLNGQADQAASTIDCAGMKDKAMGMYLKAIAAARLGNKDAMISSLKGAIAADANLKKDARDNAEFFKYKDDADFKAATN